MALENFLEFSPTGCPYSLSIILILGGLGGLAKMSSNLVIPLLTVKIRQPSHEFTFGVA
jgi:hypothetical protein